MKLDFFTVALEEERDNVNSFLKLTVISAKQEKTLPPLNQNCFPSSSQIKTGLKKKGKKILFS